MFLEVADRSNAELARASAPHHECGCVVKPERFRHADAEFMQLSDDEITVHWVASLQNFLHDRAGVFGVGIDLSAAQRLPKNDRPAHSLSVFGPSASIVQSARGDLAEDVRLGKFLRTDNDCAICGERGCDEGED